MKQSLQKLVQSELPDADYPDFEPGDTIRVTTREEIGGQMRTRKFEGVCISRKGEGPNETFKVRKVSFGVGVERVYPIHSPVIDEISVVRKGKVRRAKLNYLEGRSAKESRIKDRRVDMEEFNRTGDGQAETRDTVDAPKAGESEPPAEETGEPEAQAQEESAEEEPPEEE